MNISISLFLDHGIVPKGLLFHFLLIGSYVPILHLLPSLLQLLQPLLLPLLNLFLQNFVSNKVTFFEGLTSKWISFIIQQVSLDVDSVYHIL